MKRREERHYESHDSSDHIIKFCRIFSEWHCCAGLVRLWKKKKERREKKPSQKVNEKVQLKMERKLKCLDNELMIIHKFNKI